MFAKYFRIFVKKPVRWVELVGIVAVLAVVFTTVQAAPKNDCPQGVGVSGESCDWVQNQTTGACDWKIGYAYPWVPVPEDTCPALEPTLDPTPAITPTTQSTTIASPTATSDTGCPNIALQGIVDGEVRFTATYQLTTPAGAVWSFGDLRVDELVFEFSSSLILEETNKALTSYTWTSGDPGRFEVLRFHEDLQEPTCKIRFLFDSLEPTP